MINLNYEYIHVQISGAEQCKL